MKISISLIAIILLLCFGDNTTMVFNGHYYETQ